MRQRVPPNLEEAFARDLLDVVHRHRQSPRVGRRRGARVAKARHCRFTFGGTR